MSLANVVNIDNKKGRERVTLSPEMREHLVTKRQSLLIELASLERLLGLARKCKTCGAEQ